MDVSLINMEMDTVLEHQTIIVEDAQIISGSGKYLLPGFIDMHVHISDKSDSAEVFKIWSHHGSAYG